MVRSYSDINWHLRLLTPPKKIGEEIWLATVLKSLSDEVEVYGTSFRSAMNLLDHCLLGSVTYNGNMSMLLLGYLNNWFVKIVEIM